jgi:hypothetical protein
MAMAKITLSARITFAWWWKPYCYGLIAMARLTGMQPDSEKVGYWFKKAATIHFEGRKAP